MPSSLSKDDFNLNLLSAICEKHHFGWGHLKLYVIFYNIRLVSFPFCDYSFLGMLEALGDLILKFRRFQGLTSNSNTNRGFSSCIIRIGSSLDSLSWIFNNSSNERCFWPRKGLTWLHFFRVFCNAMITSCRTTGIRV